MFSFDGPTDALIPPLLRFFVTSISAITGRTLKSRRENVNCLSNAC